MRKEKKQEDVIRPFLFWREELANNPDNGLVEVNCNAKSKQKFIDAIMATLTTLDKYFVKNDLYKYNDYYQFLDSKFMDRFENEILYPKFYQDNLIKSGGSSGICEFGENYYDVIKISKNDLTDESTICHEFIHFLTLNNFYYSHPKDDRFKVYINSTDKKHYYILDKKQMSKDTTLSEKLLQDSTFFYEGLTEFLTEEVYPSEKGKSYTSFVKMFGMLSELIGKEKIIGDFLQGNVNSIESYFNAQHWAGKYIGNFGDFIKYTNGFFDDYDNAKSYYMFRELNKNYKGAIKCLTKAYYENVMADNKEHSSEEFMKLFEFCVDNGALPECYQIFRQIIQSGKIKDIQKEKVKINRMCRAFEEDYADCQYKVGPFILEIERKPDCINFILNLGEKNKLNFKFDGVDGFEADGGYEKQRRQRMMESKKFEFDYDESSHRLNQHSDTYLKEKARATKFNDKRKAKDMSIDIQGNSVKVEFYDIMGRVIHTFGVNYGHLKNATFDDETVYFDYENKATEKSEVL